MTNRELRGVGPLSIDFAVRGKEPKDEVQIYTWKDATLRELTDLVKEVAPAARRRDAKLSFAFVYPDKNGRFVVRPVGMTHSYGNGRRLDDLKALAELSFQEDLVEWLAGHMDIFAPLMTGKAWEIYAHVMHPIMDLVIENMGHARYMLCFVLCMLNMQPHNGKRSLVWRTPACLRTSTAHLPCIGAVRRDGPKLL
ncbi:hypothetical protein ACLOJK_004561 [Asimina triloba]